MKMCCKVLGNHVLFRCYVAVTFKLKKHFPHPICSLKLVIDQNKQSHRKYRDLPSLKLSKFLCSSVKLLLLICSASGIDSITSLSSVYSRGSTKKTMNLNHVCLWRNYLIFACCAYPRSPPLRSDSSEQDGGWVVHRYFYYHVVKFLSVGWAVACLRKYLFGQD